MTIEVTKEVHDYWVKLAPMLYEDGKAKSEELIAFLEKVALGNLRDDTSNYYLDEERETGSTECYDLKLVYEEQLCTLLRSDRGDYLYRDGERVRELRHNYNCTSGVSGLLDPLPLHGVYLKEAESEVEESEFEDMHDYYDNCIIVQRFTLRVSVVLKLLAKEKEAERSMDVTP